MGELTLWSLDMERPAAVVAAAARISGGSLDDLDSIMRGLRRLARLKGWPGRMAGYLLARRDAFERALEAARGDGGPVAALVEEVLRAAKAAGLTS